MRRRTVIPILLGILLVLGCSESPQPMQQSGVPLKNGIAANANIGIDSIRTLMVALFPPNTAPLDRFQDLLDLLEQEPPDVPQAQVIAWEIVDLTLTKFRAGELNDGTSPQTQQNVIVFVNGLLALVGLPPGLTPGALDPDGAAAVITPTSPPTTVVTQTLFSGIQVNTGQVPTTTLITITRLPNSPAPLLTGLDQFPFFYEFTASPPVTFTSDVLLGVCQPSNIVIPDPTRLRIAHNIAPFTPGSVEILPKVNAPFIDCTLAVQSSMGFGASLLQNLARLALPSPLYATAAGGGLGGTTRKLSPFGAVDTLGRQDAVTGTIVTAKVGSLIAPAPAVVLKTPTGKPIAGITVTFAVTAGGGTVTGAVQVTDANGVARVGSWKLGPAAGLNTLVATPTRPQGAGFINAPTTFKVTGKK